LTGSTDVGGNSLWHRLRRRKMGQWGVAYVAGAWGFLQGLQYVSGLMKWPDQPQRLTGLLLLIGLPIVLVIAWYHGDRGEQRVTRIELAILTLLFLTGGGLFWHYEHTSEPPSATSETTAPVSGHGTTTDAGPSIAVLPFENRSDEHKDVFFVDGIHDDILTELSKIGALKVISRTSVEQFRDTKLPTKTIADQLGVRSILEGGVQRAGDRVRINVQLIDAATDAHLWAETYDRELTAENIFAIQTELAAAIADALKAALTPAEKTRVKAVPTQNLAAWEAYQRGKQRMADRTSAGLADAARFFQKAIDLDPRFALAYVGLADSLVLQIEYGGAPLTASLARARDTVARALELEPDLADAHATSGLIAQDQDDFEQAAASFRKAIELNPNYAPSYHWYSVSLMRQGRASEALPYIEQALALDPLSPVVNTTVADVLSSMGRFRDALAQKKRTIELAPTMADAFAKAGLDQAYGLDNFVAAVPLLRKSLDVDSGNPANWAWLATAYLDMGDGASAARILARVMPRGAHDPFANLALAMGALYSGGPSNVDHAARARITLDPSQPLLYALLRNEDVLAHDLAAARSRYQSAYPELMTPLPRVGWINYQAAIDVALLLQQMSEGAQARTLLDESAATVSRSEVRLGPWGYGIADVQIHALRAEKTEALAALRAAERAGWRGPFWRYYRDFDPALASIRSEPEFKAVFVDIARDMADQRAVLAARPKDAPFDLE
jgi:TolB-like protein